MESSSSSNVGEVGGTGDESIPLGSESSSVAACDACEGCDDVCDSKGMGSPLFQPYYP
jgi:hypothetical protein